MGRKDITDKQVCEAYAEYEKQVRAVKNSDYSDVEFLYEILRRQTGRTDRECIKVIERADDKGLIEFGSSSPVIRLTDKGRALLDDSI